MQSSATLTVRVRTKDGTERLQVPAGATLAQLREAIADKLGVPTAQQALARSDPMGRQKGAPFTPPEEAQPLAALDVANGTLLFLDYAMERENQAHYVEKDPFATLVKEGELRQQGKTQWTLTNFLDHRSSKEFVLGAPPEPHAKFVQIDGRATQTLMNHMIMIGFKQKRVGWLYGRWVTDEATGEPGVQVHAIYEPKQDCTLDEIVVLDDPEGEARIAKLVQMLGLTCVGIVMYRREDWNQGLSLLRASGLKGAPSRPCGGSAHPAREYVFSVNELLLAAKHHAAAVAAEPAEGCRFVLMKARPVLETEHDIEGVATVEAYQVTDQCVELAAREAFSESKTDPRVAKCAKDCTFLVEKKEQRKATVEHFVARVFDVGRALGGAPFASFLSSGFPIENRPTEVQDGDAMAAYLRRRKAEPFLRTVSDLHFLLFLSNFLDMNTEMPVLCATILEGKAGELDGFQLMINCYAGLE